MSTTTVDRTTAEATMGGLVLESAAQGRGALVLDLTKSTLTDDILARLPLHRAEDVMAIRPERECRFSLMPPGSPEALLRALKALSPSLNLAGPEVEALETFARWQGDGEPPDYQAVKPKLCSNRALALLWRMIEELDFGTWDCRRGQAHVLHGLKDKLLVPLLDTWTDPAAATLLYGDFFHAPEPSSLVFVEIGDVSERFWPLLATLATGLLPSTECVVLAPATSEGVLRHVPRASALRCLGRVTATSVELTLNSKSEPSLPPDSWASTTTSVERARLVRELSRLKHSLNPVQVEDRLHAIRSHWEAPKALLDGQPRLTCELIARSSNPSVLAEALAGRCRPESVADFDGLWEARHDPPVGVTPKP